LTFFFDGCLKIAHSHWKAQSSIILCFGRFYSCTVKLITGNKQEKAYQLQLATCNKRLLQQAANIVAARKEGGGILKRAFDLSIFRIEIAIESAIKIDKGCSMLSKIETEVAKTLILSRLGHCAAASLYQQYLIRAYHSGTAYRLTLSL
jgi:hypothetical protein